MTRTPVADLHTAHIRAYWDYRIRHGAATYRQAFADILAHRRFDADAMKRRNNAAALAIFHEGLSEIISLRLLACYAPIFRTLDRIEWQFGRLSQSYRETWKPPAVRPIMPRMTQTELPEFLRKR